MNSASITPLVGFRGIGKRFPGTVALQGVDFEVKAGACHALMGENGAGKSTLGKVLAGIHRPDEGWIEINGVAQHFKSPLDAQRAGIGIVHQELSFCPNLSVAENICLSHFPNRGGRVDWAALYQKAQGYLDEIGADCDVREELSRLSLGQVQMVQIASALATGAHIFVMDEPTSSLSSTESHRLEELIARLRKKGATILYVSHRMDEIFRLCDTVTIMRDGQHIRTMPLAETDEDEVVRLMIGRNWERFFPGHLEREVGEERLRVENFSSAGKFSNVRFTLRAGEVLGVAGLMGAGRSEVALGLFGLDPNATGEIYVDAKTVSIRCPQDAMSAGLGFVSEDRKGNGLVLGMECGENITLPSLNRLSRAGVIHKERERSLVSHFFQKLHVKAASPEATAQSLSGGNQQKLVLAKWLARDSRVLILDEPTRGVDVGAKAEIHRLIDALAASGNAILMISSELPEILNLSTRIMVMRAGRVTGMLNRFEATEERVMQLMAASSVRGQTAADSSESMVQS
ncbi:MAG TPA: sugar ABC transporter ATP-binding protein [Verrucomicrobiae bacterium]|nr:sugar ABC transporter ATP-binding protein [Verrucomicrobiae bacterium]